ncbi:MAG TPA: SMI1/KNR4 family protein [Gemmatimonadaceae bacterium]|nr:SMI1/KNR4 family protein [Gemmatimonadaceae bacterium]
MEFQNVTYQGPPIDDPDILAALPIEYRELLENVNGLIAFAGGLHIRGACAAPDWHSLRHACHGPEALHTKFRAARPADLPFAQDAFGNQLLLREDQVWRLAAESGEVEPLGADLLTFLEEACRDPIEYLSLAPLERFRAEGGDLRPGQLLNVDPPFVMQTAGLPSLRAIAAADRLGFLAHLSAQIANLPDGARVEFKIVE